MLREVNEMPHCACCGILVPAQEVVAEHHGRQMIFCGARCVRVYDSYKYPTYRDDIDAAEAAGNVGRLQGYIRDGLKSL